MGVIVGVAKHKYLSGYNPVIECAPIKVVC